MPRTPHYWRPSGRTSCPDNFLFFDSETVPTPHPKGYPGEFHRLRLGVALAYRLVKGKRTREREVLYRTAGVFWAFVESCLSRDRPLWIVAHNTAFDMGTVDGWRVLSSKRFAWDTAIFEGGTFFLRGSMDGCPVVVSDTTNYYRCSLKAVGRSVGIPKLPMPDFGEPDHRWATYCRNDVQITAAGMDLLIAFWKEHELGPWQPTIGSLAFSAFRHRFMRHKVLVHTDQNVLDLERGCYYGGRVDTPYIGEVPSSTIHEVDFSSLYPSTYTQPLPYYPVGAVAFPRPREVLALGSDTHILADVTLRTKDTTYPVRVKSRVYHPRGTYRTMLADPELRRALAAGHVLYVHYAAWFKAAPVFEDYLHYFYSLKCQYDKAGDEGFRTLCKYLLNSLYGKAGQLSPRWLAWNAEAMRMLEFTHGLPEGSLAPHAAAPPRLTGPEGSVSLPGIPDPLPIRCYWGYLEVQVDRKESRDSTPALASTVTSYGRLKLSDAQRAAGGRHWFYSDTDSLWVDDVGLGNLSAARMVGDGSLGKLEHKRSVSRMAVHGRKDYEFDGERRLKGVRPNAEEIAPAVYRQHAFPSAGTQLADRLADGVFVREVVKHLRRTVDWCRPGADGWTRPLVFPEDSP